MWWGERDTEALPHISSSDSWVDRVATHSDMQEKMKSRHECVKFDSRLTVNSQQQEPVGGCMPKSEANMAGFTAIHSDMTMGGEDQDMGDPMCMREFKPGGANWESSTLEQQ